MPTTRASAKEKTAPSRNGTAKATKSVEEVLASYPEDTRKLANRIRRLVKRAVPKATEAVKWGMVVFEHHGNLCYLKGQKGYVRFGFYEQGAKLDDPEGLLEGTGKSMRHVKVRGEADIRPIFDKWLKQVAAMNEA